MELYDEIIEKFLNEREKTAKIIIQNECYSMLSQIREIIRNDEFDDFECFEKIEKIVCLFEKLGSSGGNRHDF